MEIITQIQEFISSVPKPVIFAIVILVLLGGFFIWKKMSKNDSETETETGFEAANRYAHGVADDLQSPLIPSVPSVVGAVSQEEEEEDEEEEEESDFEDME